MFVSLNEIEVSAKRAARGTGASWGIAEEAGKAARWLAARGLPGVAVLVALLHEQQGQDAAAVSPRVDNGAWSSAGAALCPLHTGAAIADDAAEIIRIRKIKFQRLRAPLLLLPFLARAARAEARPLRFEAGTLAVSVDANGAAAADGDMLIALAPSATLTVQDQVIDAPLQEKLEAAAVGDATWQALQKLAARTYVPASDRSRLAGAGAGLTDND